MIALFIVMDACALWAEIFANPNSSAEGFMISMGALIAIEVFTWWFVWELQIGILRRGYPQLMHCRLR